MKILYLYIFDISNKPSMNHHSNLVDKLKIILKTKTKMKKIFRLIQLQLLANQ